MKKGFTLIELLVVISIIGILSTLIIANLNSARERSRDAQRKADLRNLQTALRMYYNDAGGYPSGLPAWGSAWTVGLTTYMSALPKDPLSSQNYRYSFVDGDNYTLEACLENKSDDKGVATSETGWCSSGWKYVAKP